MEQIELIQIFLIPTRNNFRFLTGNLWPEFELHETYLAQWEQLQTALDEWMHSFYPECEGLQLIALLELTDLSCRCKSTPESSSFALNAMLTWY